MTSLLTFSLVFCTKQIDYNCFELRSKITFEVLAKGSIGVPQTVTDKGFVFI